ncbi:MAG TPA: alpha/beta hydrolase, partial [Solirubrobacterales bacterium]
MGSEEVCFTAGDGECVGQLFRPRTSIGPVPCVVMGSGLSCVRDQGLDTFAAQLADAGFAALAFDYRHWGQSPG